VQTVFYPLTLPINTNLIENMKFKMFNNKRKTKKVKEKQG